jgi:hypothetical protein
MIQPRMQVVLIVCQQEVGALGCLDGESVLLARAVVLTNPRVQHEDTVDWLLSLEIESRQHERSV